MVFNGIIKKVCVVGVVVVFYDGVVIEFCVYCVIFDFCKMGECQVDYFVECFNGKGNIFEICGLVGVLVDGEIYVGIMDGFKKYLGFKIVGFVNGDWVQIVVQKVVVGILLILFKVDGVVIQGGDGFGVV